MGTASVDRKVITTYDALQHCIVIREPDGNQAAMDCPYTGKGVEFSPTNMAEAALAGCMLMSMGTLAMRDGIDLTGAEMEVKFNVEMAGNFRFTSIDIVGRMPAGLPAEDRIKLEKAAELCPIKHMFSDDIPIDVKYTYPD